MTVTTADITAMIDRWQAWASGLNHHAQALRGIGETFDADLKQARATVRRAAAALLRTTEPREASMLMHRNAIEASIRIPPLIGYDQAALDYTRARTWQACAWDLDPNLPEVQPRW